MMDLLLQFSSAGGDGEGASGRVKRQSPPPEGLELPPISSDGPHPLISGIYSEIFIDIYQIFFADSLFSLIIFIYVAVTFLYIFYAFCWREPPRKELTDVEKKNIPMITEQLSQIEENESTAEV